MFLTLFLSLTCFVCWLGDLAIARKLSKDEGGTTWKFHQWFPSYVLVKVLFFIIIAFAYYHLGSSENQWRILSIAICLSVISILGNLYSRSPLE